MTRRPRTAASLVTAVVALTGLLLPWPGPVVGLSGPVRPAPHRRCRPSSRPFSRFTAGAADRPAGRAIALYEYGSPDGFNPWQTLVAGADRDTYRQLDTVSQVLLSPDGTQVLSHHEDQARPSSPCSASPPGRPGSCTRCRSTATSGRPEAAGLVPGRAVRRVRGAGAAAGRRHRGEFVPRGPGDRGARHPRPDHGHDGAVPADQPGVGRGVRPVRAAAARADRPRGTAGLAHRRGASAGAAADRSRELGLGSIWSPDGSRVATVVHRPARKMGSASSTSPAGSRCRSTWTSGICSAGAHRPACWPGCGSRSGASTRSSRCPSWTVTGAC